MGTNAQDLGRQELCSGIIFFELLTRGETAHGPPQTFVVAKAQVEHQWPEHLADSLIKLALDCTGDSLRPSFAGFAAKIQNCTEAAGTLVMPSSTNGGTQVATTILEAQPKAQMTKEESMNVLLRRVGVPRQRSDI